ncbi:MAG: GNAT family N-acetyltransferase [Fastidiosipila sp.]|jgi:threonine aldolase|nr:GNAT family N-acetyltransferase [Fastidiosipila sp.]
MDFEFSIKGITLETDRLQLRPWELSDLDDFHAYARVPGVGEMAGWPHHRSIEETRTILRQFMEAGEVLAVYHKKDRKVIGSMGVHPVPQTLPEAFQNRHAKEIGYALSKTYWGQGLTAEALAVLVGYLFRFTPATLLVGCCSRSNHQSRRVLEKTGFAFSRTFERKRDVPSSEASLEFLLTEEAYRAMKRDRISFENDYNAGCHPALLEELIKTNQVKTSGYGLDAFCEEAARLIKEACRAPGADVHFLVGGTQVNLIVAAGALKPWQGIISAGTGHINVHEAGAIEATGHKVLVVPSRDGLLDAAEIDRFCQAYQDDPTAEHMVQPGMIYLSQPTELGTVYKKEDLEAIRKVADQRGLILYVDGARLAAALAVPETGLGLADMARLCDLFTIGGTKCGALFGEALVISRESLKQDFRSLMKQRGGLLAKGRLLGIQFAALFRHDLYCEIGRYGNQRASELAALFRSRGIDFMVPPQTNQLFVMLDPGEEAFFAERAVFERIMTTDDGRQVCRFVTSYTTRPEDIERLLS